jgi:hypothetical protein
MDSLLAQSAKHLVFPGKVIFRTMVDTTESPSKFKVNYLGKFEATFKTRVRKRYIMNM